MWLQGVSTKAIADTVAAAEKSYKRFFKKLQSRPPRFKSRRNPITSFFIVRDNIHFNTGRRNIIKLPILGYIRITEPKYLPDNTMVTSGRIIRENDKYYVSFIYDTYKKSREIKSPGIGIDVGIKNYVSIASSDNSHIQIPSFIKHDIYKSLEKKIKRIQNIISFKAEVNLLKAYNQYVDTHDGKQPSEKLFNIMKGESYDTSCIRKLYRKLKRLYSKRTNYGNDYINKIIASLVRAKPEYITIENLDIQNLLSVDSSHKLHDYIAKNKFYYFKERLMQKCNEYNIELRIADKYFASSKKCCVCGHKKKDLSLSDRMYFCEECGNYMDRDLNAAHNLCKLSKYTVVV
jgi:putative transposase